MSGRGNKKSSSYVGPKNTRGRGGRGRGGRGRGGRGRGGRGAPASGSGRSARATSPNRARSARATSPSRARSARATSPSRARSARATSPSRARSARATRPRAPRQISTIEDVFHEIATEWSKRRGRKSYTFNRPYDYFLLCRDKGESDKLFSTENFDRRTHIHLIYNPVISNISAIPKTEIIKRTLRGNYVKKIMRPEILINANEIGELMNTFPISIEQVVESITDLLEALLNCTGEDIPEDLVDRETGEEVRNKEISLINAFMQLGYKINPYESNFKLVSRTRSGRGFTGIYDYDFSLPEDHEYNLHVSGSTPEDLQSGLMLSNTNALEERDRTFK